MHASVTASMKQKPSRSPKSKAQRSSDMDKIIKGLNEDLAREYQAIIQYVVFSAALKGPEYGDIAAHLKAHASEELQHALDIAEQIDYLGGKPTIKMKEAQFSEDPKKMLEIDLKSEQETIKNYKERIRQAEDASEFALSEKLRGIILQEQDHAMDLEDALGL